MDLSGRTIDVLLERIRSFPYLSKKIILIVDLIIVACVFTLSYAICYSLAAIPVLFLKDFLVKLTLCLIITGLCFSFFTTYRGVMRYSTFSDGLRIFMSLFVANIVLLIAISIGYGFSLFSHIEVFINFFLCFSVIFCYRMTIRLLYDYIKNVYAKKKNLPLLIYGTKPAHVGLAKMIRDNEDLPYTIAGFISSGSFNSDQEIMNTPIYSKNDFFHKKDNDNAFKHIKAVLIISEELEPADKQLWVDVCMERKMELLSAPPFVDWKNWEKKSHEIKKFQIEDLLGRVPIEIDVESICENLKGKTILITGAAGSIGSEIVRQLSRFNVGMLLLCDIAESPLHQLSLELSDRFPDAKFQLLIADVRNRNRMKFIFETYRPDYIYHAAAYKHVPMMEEHPYEAVLTNVLGTKNMADLAVACHSECFVMISTDKAVNPSNVMGASKRIAEIYIQYLVNRNKEQEKQVRFITTRFGNVLGSNGSVIPRFTKQIEAGGPITVTHPDIIRYFMTIPEACSLVLEAGNFGNGGEIFVFDMGDSVRIKDMAESMIRLSGFEPYTEIDIVFTGLRPGEKLYEELLYDKEKVQPTHNKKIMIGGVEAFDYDKIMPLFEQLIEASTHSHAMNVVKIMKEIVPEFVSQNSVFRLLDDE